MGYIKTIFGKELNKLTYEDIETYFQSPKSETDIIEYKSFSSIEQLKKIRESVCALLNSQGGVIIWGAPTESKNDNIKKFHGELTLTTNLFEKDFLTNSINDKIIPLPNCVRVERIEKELKYLYIFEIDNSEYSPHQVEGRYYMRIDGQTRIAPHHYTEALFRKIRYPNLGGYLRFNNFEKGSAFYNYKVKCNISILILNHSKLQNEENIYYSLAFEDGLIATQKERQGTLILSEDEKELKDISCHPLLPYGAAFYQDAILLIDPNGLMPNGRSIFKITLSFGGKHSPMKISYYELHIGRNDNMKDVNRCVKVKKENVLVHESDFLIKDENDRINKLLGRDS